MRKSISVAMACYNGHEYIKEQLESILKQLNMKHLITLLILLGATFLSPSHSRANPYTLSYSLVDPNRLGKPVNRLPKRPLVVDLVGHTLTLPSQVIGNTLTLENADGEVYTYYIIDTTFQIPEELSGEYSLKISDGNSMYQGMIELK